MKFKNDDVQYVLKEVEAYLRSKLATPDTAQGREALALMNKVRTVLAGVPLSKEISQPEESKTRSRHPMFTKSRGERILEEMK